MKHDVDAKTAMTLLADNHTSADTRNLEWSHREPGTYRRGYCKLCNRPCALSKDPVQVVGNPVHSAGNPVHVVGNPVHSAGNPVHVVGDPVQVVRDPVQRVGDPVHLLTICNLLHLL